MARSVKLGRRDVLKAGAGLSTAGIVGLSGCMDGGDDEEDGYPSSDIEWTIPFGAGGGYDAYSRAICQHMPSHLPNEVEMVPENRPGGGSRTGTNHVYRADPDGYTIGMIDTFGSAAYQTVIEPDFDDFDITEFRYFGTAAWEPYGFWTAWDSEYETVEDLQAADQIRITTSGLGSAASNSGIVAADEMELNNENVFGYDGTAESITATIRGDGDIVPVNGSSARSLYDDEEIRPIVVFADEGLDWAPEAQAAGELGYEGIVSVGRFERALGAPPETSDDVVETLEEAWLATAEDEEFISWSEENDRPILPEDGATTLENTEAAVETFQEYAEVFERAQEES